jgi:hypothetical protein
MPMSTELCSISWLDRFLSSDKDIVIIIELFNNLDDANFIT